MFNELINIAQNLWSAFFPKKIKVSERLIQWEPPYHFNCRSIAIPLRTNERQDNFNEACHSVDAMMYSIQINHQRESRLSSKDQHDLKKFIDGIYEAQVSFSNITLNENVIEKIIKPKLACIVCFNGECSCRI